MTALEREGDSLLGTLFDLCSETVLESTEVRGVVRVGVFEQLVFGWARRGVRNVFDPVASWMGSEIVEHPGKTGDMVCWFVRERDVRLQWPEPIEADEFGPSMEPAKLLSSLGSSEATTRVAALAEIGDRGGTGAMVAFMAGLGDGDPEVRYGAALILEELAEQRWGPVSLTE